MLPTRHRQSDVSSLSRLALISVMTSCQLKSRFLFEVGEILTTDENVEVGGEARELILCTLGSPACRPSVPGYTALT